MPLSREDRLAFLRILRERIPNNFCVKIWAEDPNDPDNRRELPPSALRGLVKSGFINAQRGLDDVTSRESDVLAKTVENLFATASSASAGTADKQIADALKGAVQDIQTQIDTNFGNQLNSLIPALETFGYQDWEDRSYILKHCSMLASCYQTSRKFAIQVIAESHYRSHITVLVHVI